MFQARFSVLTIAVLGLFAATAHCAENMNVATAPPQLQQAVARLANMLERWKVYNVDTEPSVAIDGRRGYRVVLRMTWKEPPVGYQHTQQEVMPGHRSDVSNYITKHTDCHFVLVPLSKAKLATDAKREILWHVPDDKQFRLPVAMGDGLGFEWFTFATISDQHFLRERLMLTGGDDRLQLLLRGLAVDDEGTIRNSIESLFVQFGEPGFAALDEIIRKHDDESQAHRSVNAIRAMRYFRDAKATARLVELYHSRHKLPQRAAAYALICRPLRPEAKSAYLHMLSGQQYLPEAILTCGELGLKEALPELQRLIEKPPSLGIYRDAYTTYRKLVGIPIDAKLQDADNTLHRQSAIDPKMQPTDDELAAARHAIRATQDVEGAALVGLGLATANFKGNNEPSKKIGVEILRMVPRQAVETALGKLLNGVADGYERNQLIKLQEQVL